MYTSTKKRIHSERRTDGTELGTKMIKKDLFTSNSAYGAAGKSCVHERPSLFVGLTTLDDSDLGPQLWKTDGQRLAQKWSLILQIMAVMSV